MEKKSFIDDKKKSCLNHVKRNYDERNKNEKCYIALKSSVLQFILNFR